MTKGMLSLIENNKAKPSIENLAYIAEKLNIGVNELLETIGTTELRELLKEAEHQFREKKYEKVIEEIADVIEELPEVYESAKLIEIYGKSCYYTDKSGWEDILHNADDLYMFLNLYNQSSQLTQFLIWTITNQHHYEKALHELRRKKEELQERQADIDIINELDFLWLETGLLFAINNYDEASECLNEAISLSKQKNVFYKIEELYRIAYFYAMINNREDDMDYYLNKLTLFAEFTESEDSKINVMALQIEYNIIYAKRYDEALKLIEEVYSKAEEELKNFYVMEKGKALYGNQEYEQALEYLLQFEEEPTWNHPFDLSIMYEVYAYIARCYLNLGQTEEAYKNAKYAMDHVVNLPHTPFKTFIEETMELVIKKFNLRN